MNTTKSEMLLKPSLFSRVKNTMWKPRETVQDSSSGQNNSAQMVNGLGSTQTFWLKRGLNTSTRYTLGPNTTTTHMMWTRPPSKEIYSNTTTRTICPVKITPGSLSENALTSLHPLTLRIQQEKSLITLVLWYWVLMVLIIIIFSK